MGAPEPDDRRPMNVAREPELAELAIADPPERWQALGFDVDENGNMDIGGVRVRLGERGGKESPPGRCCG